jgi:predicted O-linked N-acetylglucosamine transferase (SPINDLY family)
MTSSILTAIGHGDWRANDEGDYVEKVAGIAADPSLRSELCSSLRDSVRRSPLFDAQGLARALENAFEGMLDRSAARQISRVR